MTEKEIEMALVDIAEIRQSIQGKLKVIRPLFLDRAFAPFSLVFGIVIASLLVAVHLLYVSFDGFAGIPISAKIALSAVLTILLGVSGFLKQRIITRALRKQDRSLTIFSLFRLREFREFYTLSAYGFILIAAGASLVCVPGDASWWLLLPVYSMYIGFIFALMSLVFRLPEFRVLSVVSALFGFAALACMKYDHFLWLAAFAIILPGTYSLIVIFSRSNRIERA